MFREDTADIFLERVPPDWKEVLKFRLLLRGHLPSGNRPSVPVKHALRRQFHPQLQAIWRGHPWLRGAWDQQPNGKTGIERLADNQAKYGYRWVPLVQQQMSCSLDILMLRRHEPFRVFGEASGDLDNRIKTLIDSLQMPQQGAEVDGPAQSGEDPFFCLLENDRLIYHLHITTDALWVPPEIGEPERDVFAVISVNVKNRGDFDMASWAPDFYPE